MAPACQAVGQGSQGAAGVGRKGGSRATRVGRAAALCGSLNVRAPEGTQARDLARAERPDLVLLNVGLPQMKGQQNFRRSRPTRLGGSRGGDAARQGHRGVGCVPVGDHHLAVVCAEVGRPYVIGARRGIF